jgi:hypothetical protein
MIVHEAIRFEGGISPIPGEEIADYEAGGLGDHVGSLWDLLSLYCATKD